MIQPQQLSRFQSNGAIPVRLSYDVEGSSGDYPLELPDWPGSRFEVTDCHIVSTNTVAGAVAVKNKTNGVSDAMSKSGTANVITRAGAILTANSIIEGRKDLIASIASAGAPAFRLFIDGVLHWDN